MSEEFDPVVHIDERDCIGGAEEEVADLKIENAVLTGSVRDYKLRCQEVQSELFNSKLTVQAQDDELEAKEKELEHAKEQIRKCHTRLARWGKVLGVVQFAIQDVDKA